MSVGEGIEVSRQRHKEDSVICVCPASIGFGLIGPLSAAVAPCSSILLGSPRVSHLDELIVACLYDAQDGVGVTLDETLMILVGVVGSTSVHLDELIFCIALGKLGPEYLSGSVTAIMIMLNAVIRCTAKGSSRQS